LRILEGTYLAEFVSDLPRRRIAQSYKLSGPRQEKTYGGQLMKRILISAVLALALAGTSAFAAQNKNAPAKKPAAKTANKNAGGAAPAAGGSSTMSSGKSHGKKKHHRKSSKASNAEGGGTAPAKKPAKNSNK